MVWVGSIVAVGSGEIEGVIEGVRLESGEGSSCGVGEGEVAGISVGLDDTLGVKLGVIVGERVVEAETSIEAVSDGDAV